MAAEQPTILAGGSTATSRPRHGAEEQRRPLFDRPIGLADSPGALGYDVPVRRLG